MKKVILKSTQLFLRLKNKISRLVNIIPRFYLKDALIVFLLFALVFAFFYHDGGWNANSRFGLIFSIVRGNRLFIDYYYDNYKLKTQTIDHAYFDGHYYSDKAIGSAMVGVVFYKLIHWIQPKLNPYNIKAIKYLLTFFTIGLPSALTGSLIYIFCYYLSRNRFKSYLSTLSIAMGTMFFPFSTVFFSHQLTSSLLFWAFGLIFLLKKKPKRWENELSLLIGLFLGWALISEYPSVIIVIPLVIYYFSIVVKNNLDRRLILIIFPLLGGLIPIILQLSYNKLCFDNFFSIGYSNTGRQVYIEGMQQGLWGFNWPNLEVLFYMTLHPLMGVFWQSPVLILSLIGIKNMLVSKHYRGEAILAAFIIFSYFVIFSGFTFWWGGSSIGVRYIIPVLPFFVIFLIFIPDKFILPELILSLISIAQMLILSANSIRILDPVVYKFKKLDFFEFSNIYNISLKRLINGNFAPSLGQYLFGLDSWFSLMPLLIGLVGFSIIFFRDELKSYLLRCRN